MQENKGIQDALDMFINHHVFHHAGSTSGWNVPFLHINSLEWFKYDAIMLVCVIALLLGTALAVRRNFARVPTGLAAIAEIYVLFIRDQIVYANIGEKYGRPLLSFFCTLFCFILFGNMLGLIPVFSTVTGNISVTSALALIFMVVCLYTTIKVRGIGGLVRAFIPHGMPAWLTPFISIIEVISFFSRVFALAIRLFCNMLAGHIVIYSLLGLTVLFGWVAFPAVFVSVLMYLFEVFVAFLQAYIFTLLVAIFINMMVNVEH